MHRFDVDVNQLGPEVVLEVTAQNRPCGLIRVYHSRLVEEITGKREVTTVVVNPGIIRPGDACQIVMGAHSLG